MFVRDFAFAINSIPLEESILATGRVGLHLTRTKRSETRAKIVVVLCLACSLTFFLPSIKLTHSDSTRPTILGSQKASGSF